MFGRINNSVTESILAAVYRSRRRGAMGMSLQLETVTGTVCYLSHVMRR